MKKISRTNKVQNALRMLACMGLLGGCGKSVSPGEQGRDSGILNSGGANGTGGSAAGGAGAGGIASDAKVGTGGATGGVGAGGAMVDAPIASGGITGQGGTGGALSTGGAGGMTSAGGSGGASGKGGSGGASGTGGGTTSKGGATGVGGTTRTGGAAGAGGTTATGGTNTGGNAGSTGAGGGGGAASGGTVGSGGASGGTTELGDAGSSTVPQCLTTNGATGWGIPGQPLICETNCTGCAAVCAAIGTRSEGWYAGCAVSMATGGCSSNTLIEYANCATCGGIAGVGCASGEFCDLPTGSCNVADATGTCKLSVGLGCIAIYQPVCGCDGKTYASDCVRQSAGVSKKSDGECPTADAGRDVGPSVDGSALATLCTATGGQVTSALCCNSTADFPNSCATGPCGCAPSYSHIISICACPFGCFMPDLGCAAPAGT